MNPIDDKIYALVTKQENFEIAFDVNERYEDIIYRLCKDFWEDLQLKFKSKYKIVDSSDNDKLWKFTFIPKGWKYFSLFMNWDDKVEKVGYGIGVDNLKSKKQGDIIKKNIQEILIDFVPIPYQDSKEIWFKQYFNDDFEKLSGLRKILPENRDKTAEEYFGVLIELINNLSKTIIDLEKNI